MNDFIPTDMFLAYILLDKPEISFEEIWGLKEKMKSRPDLDVDLSIPSIIEAIEYYPRVFRLDRNRIVRSESFDESYVKELLFDPKDPADQLKEFFQAA